MRTSISISFSEFTSHNETYFDLVKEKLLLTGFDSEQGYGFQDINILGNIISAVLVKRSATFIQQINPTSGQLEENEIFVYARINFNIDFDYRTLDVLGPISNSGKVRSILRTLLKNEVSIASIVLAPHEVVNTFNLLDPVVNINSLTVNNFRHRDGITGRYDMKFSVPELAHEVITSYQHDIVKAQIQVMSSPVGEFEATISKNGHLNLVSQNDNLGEVCLYFKSIVLNREV